MDGLEQNASSIAKVGIEKLLRSADDRTKELKRRVMQFSIAFSDFD